MKSGFHTLERSILLVLASVGLPAMASAQGGLVPPQGAATQVVTVSEIASGTATSIEQLLDGYFAGVQILENDGAPGSAFTTRVRGVRSFRGDTQPLVILDGIILNGQTADADKTFWADKDDLQSLQNTLDNINPQDVESITILKDASATALYGSMGGNGVIIIKTKSGSNSAPVATWSSRVGLSTSGIESDVTRLAISHKHGVSVRGGAERNDYAISASYDKQNGIIKNSDLQSIILGAKYNQNFGAGSNFGTAINIGSRKNDMVMASSPSESASLTKALYKGLTSETAQNWLDAYDDYSQQYSVAPVGYINANLGAGVWLKANAGFDFRNKTRFRWVGSDVERGKEVQGQAGQTGVNALRYNADAALTYDIKTVEDEVYSFMIGTGVNGSTFTEYVYEGTTFFSEELRAPGISLAEKVKGYRHVENNNLTFATYASASYSYKDIFSFGAAARIEKLGNYDEKLSLDNLYPTIFANYKPCQNVSIRASWGKSGMQEVKPLGYDNYYISAFSTAYPIDGLTNYYTLRWKDVTTQGNIGVDLSFLDSRIKASIDLYDATSKDLLRYYYHEPKSDYRTVLANRSQVNNKGVELQLAATAVKKGDIKWDINASFAHNINRIATNGSVRNAFGTSVGTWYGNDATVNVFTIGESVGSIYGYKAQRLVGKEHTLLTPPYKGDRLEEGDVKLIDVTGDGKITAEDQTVIGDVLPKFTAGLNTTFTWKDLSVYAAVSGAFDFDVVNMQKLYSSFPAEGQPANGVLGSEVVSSRIVEDGSFVRLSNLAVSYNLPVGKIGFIDALSLTASARNLLTLSNYSGWSPVVNSYGADPTRMGIDNGAYPSCRTFMLGLTVKF